MDIFDRIDCVIGDSFFFISAEDEIRKNLCEQYNVKAVNQEFIFSDDGVEKLNTALFPNLFDIDPKIVILRNIKNKFIEFAVKNLKYSNNIYLLIENETDQIDGRVKIFKTLDQHQCVHNVGFAYVDKTNDVLNLAFDKMEKMLNVKIDDKIKLFLKKYVPKIERDNKPIHNLNRIYSEIKKCNNSIEICKNIISHPQTYQNIFEITNALSTKNFDLMLNVIDNHVVDIGSAAQIISLINSELQIICKIKDRKNIPFSDLYDEINKEMKNYDIEDNNYKKYDKKPLHPFRLKKILEKKNTDYFEKCDRNLQLCVDAYNDLYYYYINNYKLLVIKLCYQICS